MREVFIGEVIKNRRKELGLTQEQLCEGICEPITISRLENKKQTISRNNVKALLQRLGLPDDRFYAVLNDEEVAIDRLYRDICSNNVNYERSLPEQRESLRKEGMLKLQELEKLIGKDDNLLKQFILRSRLILGREDGSYSKEEQLDMLMEAIKLTQPRFRIEQIKDGLYSFEDMKFIHNIAIAYSELGNREEALRIWEPLVKNIENRFENIVESRSILCLTLYGISRELLIMEDFDRARVYAQKGVNIAVKYGVYQNLPGYKIILAECEYNDGNFDKCRKQLIESYYLCESIGDAANKRVAAANIKEHFDIDIESISAQMYQMKQLVFQ